MGYYYIDIKKYYHLSLSILSPAKSSEVTWDYGVVRSVDHKGRTCVVKWLSSLPGLAHQRFIRTFFRESFPCFSNY